MVVVRGGWDPNARQELYCVPALSQTGLDGGMWNITKTL